jgi:arginase
MPSADETGTPDADVRAIEIHGAPVDHGGAGPGAAGGPAMLRAMGVTEIPGRTVHDLGDVIVPDLPPGTRIERGPDPDSRRPEWPPLQAICASLHARTRASVEAGAIPITLGGDHTLAAGSMSGVLAGWRRRHGAGRVATKTNDLQDLRDLPPLGLIWFDAHVDLNTPDTTLTGNPHGMPLAALLGYGVAPLDDIVTNLGIFDRSRVALLGGRDLDPAERARTTTDRIAAGKPHPLLIDGETFTRETPEAIAERVLDLVAPNSGDAFALSFDLDVIDPKEAPGVNLRSPNGLDPDTVFRVLETLARHGGCQAMDIVELDPTADDENGTTARFGVQAARTMFGVRG